MLVSFEGKRVILGIRPEDLEDSALETDAADGQTLKGKLELREALGSEIMAHLSFKGAHAETDETRELARDSGAEGTEKQIGVKEDEAVVVGRFGARSRVKVGDEVTAVVDTRALHFFDPETFHETRRITVKDNGKPETELNELEYIHGEIYANVWHTDRIARVSPATGRVIGWIDLKGLMPRSQLTDDEAVLNGIAYDAAHDRLFVTGKLWPKIFEITLIPEKAKLVRVRHSK